jgi:hypothetical protein
MLTVAATVPTALALPLRAVVKALARWVVRQGLRYLL